MKYPFARTWWIEPGKILGGCFPGTPSPEQTRTMLNALVEAGVRTIINLQQPDECGQGGKPFPDYQPMLKQVAEQHGVIITVHSFPIADMGLPDPQQVEQILDVLRDCVAKGQVAYVHCWGGHGRTGTVAGCWLVSQEMNPQQAIETINQRRSHEAYLADKPVPQTEDQRRFIAAWVARKTPAKATPAKSPDAAAGPEDRQRGAVLGLAVGDALGTTLEFRPPGTFQPVTDMTGGGPFNLKAGEWTDDTSMALCLAESLVEKQAFDPVDQLQRYVRWWTTGHLSSNGRCFDIGNQTRTALTEHIATGKPHCGPTGKQNCGNGSLMRLAPVVVANCGHPDVAIRLAGESSKTTHGARDCVDACRYFAALLIGAIQERPKAELLSPHFSPVEGLWTTNPLSPQVDAVAAGSFTAKQPPQIRGSGFVIDCLEASIWAFATTESFEQAVLRAVNLGDDADTTGAVCGQLAGAFYGESKIPEHWRRRLARLETIEVLVDHLVRSAC